MHASCVALVDAAGQYQPATQGPEQLAAVLPGAPADVRPKRPGAQGRHVAAAVNPTPPPEYVPAGQGIGAVALTQKYPAGQADTHPPVVPTLGAASPAPHARPASQAHATGSAAPPAHPKAIGQTTPPLAAEPAGQYAPAPAAQATHAATDTPPEPLK